MTILQTLSYLTIILAYLYVNILEKLLSVYSYIELII